MIGPGRPQGRPGSVSYAPGVRWTRAQGALLVIAGVAAVGIGAWWGLVRGDDAPAARRASGASVDLSQILDVTPGCRADTCRIVDQRSGFRFEGRRATLVVVARPEPCGELFRAGVHLVTTSEILWTAPGEDLCGDPIGGIATDNTGHAFLAFVDRSGAPRQVVLRMTGAAPEDFGSLSGRFDGGRARDVDDDGVEEILVGGEVHRWTGRDYATG